jgi:hypothetical protein
MSRFDHLFNRNRLKSLRRARGKHAKSVKALRRSHFQIEALEPRLLLSADLVNPVVAADPGISSDTAAEVLRVENQSNSETSQNSSLVVSNSSTDSNVVLSNQGHLLDVAYNAVGGEIFLGNNSEITRVDSDTGAVIATFDIPGSEFTDFLGLQILSDDIPSFGGTKIDAGSLLITNGTVSPDKLFALDAVTGEQLAVLELGEDFDAVAGAFHAQRGTLFVLDSIQDRIVELNPCARMMRVPNVPIVPVVPVVQALPNSPSVPRQF